MHKRFFVICVVILIGIFLFFLASNESKNIRADFKNNKLGFCYSYPL